MIYFIRAGQFGPVKIGFTQDLCTRLEVFQTYHWEQLAVIRSYEGMREHELRLHKHYAERRIRGEWFVYCPSMLTVDPAALSWVNLVKPERVYPPANYARKYHSMGYCPHSREIIRLLGGARVVGKVCGVAAWEATSWKKFGIPALHRPALLQRAQTFQIAGIDAQLNAIPAPLTVKGAV